MVQIGSLYTTKAGKKAYWNPFMWQMGLYAYMKALLLLQGLFFTFSTLQYAGNKNFGAGLHEYTYKCNNQSRREGKCYSAFVCNCCNSVSQFPLKFSLPLLWKAETTLRVHLLFPFSVLSTMYHFKPSPRIPMSLDHCLPYSLSYPPFQPLTLWSVTIITGSMVQSPLNARMTLAYIFYNFWCRMICMNRFLIHSQHLTPQIFYFRIYRGKWTC